MADSNILSDFGINILEQEIDDVIFQTNEFLCDATFTGSQGPFWWRITIKSLGSNEHHLFIKIQLAKNFLAKPAELGVFRYSLTVAALWPLNCRS